MNWFVDGQFEAKKVPDRIGAQLNSDNKLAHQRFGPLFVALTGDKWNSAVEKVSKISGEDFMVTSELMKSAAIHRNSFLHSGEEWEITEELADNCHQSVERLAKLFVALHNAYTHPLIKSNI